MKRKLCTLDQLPDASSRGFRLDNVSLFAVHSAHQVYIYRNRCPHLGIELEWVNDQFLNSDATLIQCATHGALFLIDSGLCVAGPCQGQRLQSIPCRIEGEHIVVDELDLISALVEPNDKR